MRTLFLASSLFLVLVQCGYPVPEAYPTAPPAYATAKKYPVAHPSYSAPPPPPPPNPSTYSSSFSESQVAAAPEVEANYAPAATTYSGNAIDYNSQSTFRKRAKARTVQNRQFHRRALTPIRRFQKKAKQ